MYSWALIFGIVDCWGGGGDGGGAAIVDSSGGFAAYLCGLGLVHPIFDYLIVNFY